MINLWNDWIIDCAHTIIFINDIAYIVSPYVNRISSYAIGKMCHLRCLSIVYETVEIRFPRNHFGFIVSAEMAFPLFRIRSRAAEPSPKKFMLVTHAKLVSDSSSRFHEQQFRFILLHTFTHLQSEWLKCV